MANYIGIDLGTTYSAVASLDARGRPSIISNSNKSASPNGNITASAILFRGNESIVGDQARKIIGISDSVAARFKRQMGTEEEITVGDMSFSAKELSSIVLNEMKKVAEAELGEITKAVVTIPANFSNEARIATLEAAKIAGLEVEHIINEPTAAALYFAYKNNKKLNGTYAVYDLGGGTFDISIIAIEGNDVEVVASNGIAKLGGDDFDNALIELVKTKYQAETGNKLDPEFYTVTNAEVDKISLSKKKKVVAGGVEQEVDGETIFITRAEFEDAISGLLAQTELSCEATLDEANLSADKIDGVILAGGSTRIPAVIASVSRVFQLEPDASENPDEAIALGAALYAALKSDGSDLNATQKKNISNISLSEVANHYFGTITYGEREGGEGLTNSIILEKGSKLPCEATKTFQTMHDNQTSVDCSVTQSDAPESDPRWVKLIWEGELSLPDGRPKGMEIEVTFSYDENQIMHCRFKDVSSGKEEEISLSNSVDDFSDTSAIDKFLAD